MAWNQAYKTKTGLALDLKLDSQSKPLILTKAVIGTGTVDNEQLPNQTTISGEKQNLDLRPISAVEDGVIKISVLLKNIGIQEKYNARQIGLFATDPDSGEILYLIVQSDSDEEIPSETEVPDYSIEWTFNLSVGNAETVQITINDSDYVTHAEWNVLKKECMTHEEGEALKQEMAELYYPLKNVIFSSETPAAKNGAIWLKPI